MSDMTVWAIKGKIYESEGFIDRIQIKKKKLQEQLWELEILLKKLATLQEQFDSGLRKRKRNIHLYIGGMYRNQSFSKYVNGMRELLEGREARNATDGLWESVKRVQNRMHELERKMDEYDKELFREQDRRDYWQRELRNATAREVPGWIRI